MLCLNVYHNIPSAVQDFRSDAVRNPVWSCPGCSCSSRLLPSLPEHGPGSWHRARPHLFYQVCPRLPNCLPLLEWLPPLGLGHGPWFQNCWALQGTVNPSFFINSLFPNVFIIDSLQFVSVWLLCGGLGVPLHLGSVCAIEHLFYSLESTTIRTISLLWRLKFSINWVDFTKEEITFVGLAWCRGSLNRLLKSRENNTSLSNMSNLQVDSVFFVNNAIRWNSNL